MIRALTKSLLRLTAAIVAGAAIVITAGAWRLAAGPISLGFLSPYVRDALTLGGAGDIGVYLADTILTWAGPSRGLEIRAVDVRFSDADGLEIASIPELSLGLKARALLVGRIVPSTIVVLSPRVRLRRDAEGTVDFGIGNGGLTENRLIQRLVRELLLPPDPDAAGELVSLRIRDADVLFEDFRTGTVWHAPRANFDFARDRHGITGLATLDLAIGDRILSFSADTRFDYVRQTVAAMVSFDDLDPRHLAAHSVDLAALAPLGLPLSGTVSFEFAADGSLSPFDFDVTGGAGSLDLGSFFAEALDVDSLRAVGRIPRDGKSIAFDELTLQNGDARVVLAGRVSTNGEGPELDLGGTMSEIPVSLVKRYWPPQMAGAARRWFAENVDAGIIPQGSIRLKFKAAQVTARTLPADFAEVRFEFERGRLTYFSELPPVTEATGSVRMTGTSFELALTSGRIGGASLDDGVLELTKDEAGLWSATLEFVASGEAAEALAILNFPPLGYADRLGISLQQLGGLAAARARFRFPVRGGLTPADLEFAAAANLRGIALPDAFGGFDLTEGSFALQVNAERMSIQGTGAINGVAAGIEWREEFGPAAGATSRITITGRFDDAAREALGFSAGELLTGPLDATLEIDAAHGRLLEARVGLDLRDARIDFGPLLWSKPDGLDGQASFTVRPAAADGVIVENIDLRSLDLRANGVIEFNADRSLRRFDLSRLTFARNDISASVRPQAGGGFIIAVNGNRLDAVPYLDAFFASEGIGEVPPLRLSFQVGEVLVGNTGTISGLSGETVYGETGLDTLQMVGTLNEVAPLALAFETMADGRRILSITTTNAGALARTTGLFNEAEGGDLKIVAAIEDTEAGLEMVGRIEVEDIRIVNAPALAQVLTLASLTGILNAMNGNGITFVRADIPFTYANGVLVVDDARAFGPSLGITLEGQVNQSGNEIELFGTLVPAYSINSILGEIPLIGNLIVGRKGEGLFALNYSVSGPLDEPVITVNPLTALAPGFLRNFFRLFRGIDEPAPGNEAPEGVLPDAG